MTTINNMFKKPFNPYESIIESFEEMKLTAPEDLKASIDVTIKDLKVKAAEYEASKN